MVQYGYNMIRRRTIEWHVSDVSSGRDHLAPTLVITSVIIVLIISSSWRDFGRLTSSSCGGLRIVSRANLGSCELTHDATSAFAPLALRPCGKTQCMACKICCTQLHSAVYCSASYPLKQAAHDNRTHVKVISQFSILLVEC